MALLLVSVVGNVVSSLAPTFGLLLVGRMLTAVIHGTFLAVCVVIAGSMAAEGREGSAVAGTQLGVNLATVLGVPLGTLVAQQFNPAGHLRRRRRTRPDRHRPDPRGHPGRRGHGRRLPAAHELRVFSNWPPEVIGTVIGGHRPSLLGGMFTLITYMVPLLTDVGKFPTAWVPVVLVVYGLGSIVGNAIGGRCVNRSADAAVLGLSVTLAAVCLLYWVAAPSAIGGAVFLLLFSMATFALIPGLQAKVLAAAADAPTLSLTANMSAFGLGAALGSWAGGQIIDLGFGTRAATVLSARRRSPPSAPCALIAQTVCTADTAGPASVPRRRHRHEGRQRPFGPEADR